MKKTNKKIIFCLLLAFTFLYFPTSLSEKEKPTPPRNTTSLEIVERYKWQEKKENLLEDIYKLGIVVKNQTNQSVTLNGNVAFKNAENVSWGNVKEVVEVLAPYSEAFMIFTCENNFAGYSHPITPTETPLHAVPDGLLQVDSSSLQEKGSISILNTGDETTLLTKINLLFMKEGYVIAHLAKTDFEKDFGLVPGEKINIAIEPPSSYDDIKIWVENQLP